jgi:hypothetical protein
MEGSNFGASDDAAILSSRDQSFDSTRVDAGPIVEMSASAVITGALAVLATPRVAPD